MGGHETYIIIEADKRSGKIIQESLLQKESDLYFVNDGLRGLERMLDFNSENPIILTETNSETLNAEKLIDINQKLFLNSEILPLCDNSSEGYILMEKGATTYIQKPFQAEALWKAILRIKKRRQQEGNPALNMRHSKMEELLYSYLPEMSEQINYASNHLDYLANTYNFSNRETKKLHKAMFFHDIGKIGIPEKLRNKKGPLTKKEAEIVKRHSVLSAKILRLSKDHKEYLSIADIIEQHHEYYNGQGYPKGLSGEDILLSSRILACVETFVGFIHDKPYRKKISGQKAYSKMEFEVERGKLDPDIFNDYKKFLKERVL